MSNHVVLICGPSGGGFERALLMAAMRQVQRSAQVCSLQIRDAVNVIERAFEEFDQRAIISSEKLAELSMELATIQTDVIRKEKSVCLKPYQNRIKKFHYAANNFKRSGFQLAGKMARGRI